MSILHYRSTAACSFPSLSHTGSCSAPDSRQKRSSTGTALGVRVHTHRGREGGKKEFPPRGQRARGAVGSQCPAARVGQRVRTVRTEHKARSQVRAVQVQPWGLRGRALLRLHGGITRGWHGGRQRALPEQERRPPQPPEGGPPSLRPRRPKDRTPHCSPRPSDSGRPLAEPECR